MTQDLPPSPSAGIDDRYRAFLRALVPAVAPDRASLDDVRRAAAAVRLPWQAGGPGMHEVVDRVLPTSLVDLHVRVFFPRPTRPLPAIVYFHGGGWTLLDLDTHDRIMREYAAASGRAVIGLDCPRAPEMVFPDTVTVCAEAVDRIASGAVAGVAGPLALAGDSSGANLALATALAVRDEGRASVAALVLNYGVYDGAMNGPSYDIYSAPPFTLTNARMAWFWSQYCPDPAARRHPRASPVRARLEGLPPVRLVTTGLDVLRDENRELLCRLFDAGNAVSLDHHPRAPHAFLEALAFHDEPLAAIASAAAWLKQAGPGAA